MLTNVNGKLRLEPEYVPVNLQNNKVKEPTSHVDLNLNLKNPKRRLLNH